MLSDKLGDYEKLLEFLLWRLAMRASNDYSRATAILPVLFFIEFSNLTYNFYLFILLHKLSSNSFVLYSYVVNSFCDFLNEGARCMVLRLRHMRTLYVYNQPTN